MTSRKIADFFPPPRVHPASKTIDPPPLNDVRFWITPLPMHPALLSGIPSGCKHAR